MIELEIKIKKLTAEPTEDRRVWVHAVIGCQKQARRAQKERDCLRAVVLTIGVGVVVVAIAVLPPDDSSQVCLA